jgi:hypothetical protein
MTLFYVAGMLMGFVLVVLAAVGFEVWFYVDNLAQSRGKAADLLTSGPWKTLPRVGAAGNESPTDSTPAWAKGGLVWSYFGNGKAESGPLLTDINRYDRKPANGFRTWRWSTDGDKLTMNSSDGPAPVALYFTVGKDGDKLVLNSAVEPGLQLEKIDSLKTFPDLRVVFYAGIMAPMLIAMLLAWLISREIFYAGCLRFALGWPLTVLLGVALGAGAGYLLDVLSDQSHGTAPYWMILAFVQGAVGLATGLALAVLSCLRPKMS